MTDEKPKGKKALGRDDRLDDADLMSRKRQCPANSKRTGERCKRFCAPGARTCKFHGSATRRAKTAAAKRVAQASGYAADMLVEFMADPEVDIKLRTTIAQDLLDRSGVNSKQVMELTVDKGPSFLDYIGMAIVDVEEDDAPPLALPPVREDIVDADVVEDEPPVENRHDRAAFHESRRARADSRPVLSSEEAEAFAERDRQQSGNRAGKRREAFMRAIDAGATREQAEEAGRRAYEGTPLNRGRRRARQSTADWG